MNLTKNALEQIAARVLEDTAFVFALPREEPVAEGAWTPLGIGLQFRGPVNGRCELWAQRELGMLISANMLGMDEDSPDANAACVDALKEALNIFCGNLLTEIAGEEPVFDLTPPGTLESLTPLPEGNKSVETWLDADGHPVLMRLWIDDEASSAA